MVPTWLKSLFPRRSNRTKLAPRSARPAVRPNLVQLEDRAVPASDFTINDVSINEGNTGTTNFVFTVALNRDAADTNKTLTVDFETADNTATAGSDYGAQGPTTLTFAPGTNSKQVTIAVSRDTTVELTETFFVNLSNATTDGAMAPTISDDQGVGTIVNDDSAVISIGNAVATEGSNLSFSVTINNPVDVAITADRKTMDGSATTADSDYTPLPNANVQLFAANTTTAFTITVNTTTDPIVELNETMSVILSNLGVSGRSVTLNGGGATKAATGTINNNDTATVTIDNESELEGTTIVFTATLNNPVDTDITFDLVPSSGGTATPTTDYSTATQTITILAGMLTGTASVTTDDDAVVESNETFTATLGNLSAAGRAVTANDTATGTILNNDITVLTIADKTVAENGTSTTFTINSSLAVQGSFTVDYTTNPGSATAGADYTTKTGTASFNGTANENKSFTVTILTDNTVEATEDFTVSLFNLVPTGGVSTAGFDITDTATGKITDDDAAQFRITADANATEGSPITFTITLTNQVAVTTSVTVTTAGGTAVAGTDYTDATGMVVTFNPLDTSETFMVVTTSDITVEADETFNFTIGGLNNGGLGTVTIDGTKSTRVGTINNDDSAQFKITKAASATEAGTIDFDVTLTNPVDVATSVTVTTADISAKDGQDYSKINGQVVNFGIGVTKQTVTVTTLSDNKLEGDETFSITLGGLNNGGRGTVTIDGANNVGIGTIVDDDGAMLMVDDVTKAENGTSMTFTVTLVGDVEGGFAVNFTTLNGTATTGDNDYNLNAGTLNFVGTDGETKTITVTINNDNKVEADETYQVVLSGVVPGNAKINPSSISVADMGLGTITNDDSAQFKITKLASATEGGPVTFTVSLTNPVDVATSVTVTTTDGTAKSVAAPAFDNDFVAKVASKVNFAANVTSVNVDVATNADNIVEFDEMFTIDLGGLDNGGRTTVTIDAGNSSGTGNITNDDSAAFSIANASIGEGGIITFNITLSNPVSTDTSVTVTTADIGSALAGTDYDALMAATVMFPALTTSGTAKVQTTVDTVVEADETFKATLGGLVDGGFPTKVTISGVNGSATGTITNDDSTTLTIADVMQAEGAGMMTFTVTLGNAVQGGFKVDLGSVDGTAMVSDGDYGMLGGFLTFAGTAGETQNFTVSITDDNKVEADETFTVLTKNVVTLEAGVPAGKIANGSATATIVNDDAAQFSINAASAIVEGGMVTFTVTLSNPVDVATSVTVTTTDGTAKSGGPLAFDKDYTAKMASPVLFAANKTSVDVTVATTADNIVELDEVFTIALGGLANGGRPTVTIDAANDTGIGTITNDDAAQVKITKAASATEGNAITFTVTLTNPIDVATSVEVTTADLTANDGVDYSGLMGKLVSFAALDTSEDVTVMTTPDVVVEAHETFTATLGNLADGGRPTLTISGTDNVGTGTILNDDKATLITIANVMQDEDTGNLIFTVQLSADVQGGFNVDIMTKDGTATVAGSDYTFSKMTLPFLGMAGETKMFPVPATADLMLEADETFTVHLSNLVPNDAKVSAGDIDITSVGTGTLTNDDSTTLTIADSSLAENGGMMVFTVTLSNPVQGGLKVNYETFDNTALLSDNDYTKSTGTLTFAGTAGETQQFMVPIIGDVTIEPNEIFDVKLSNVVTLGAGVSAAKVDANDTAIGTIISDDKAVIDLFASVDTEGKNLIYTVTLSNPISKDVSVDFATLAGVGVRPALSGVDFTAVAKTVTFAAGKTSLTVAVPLTDDRRVEGSEQFDAKITNIVADASVISALSFGKDQDTATILDNDTAVFSFTTAANGASENNVAGVTATMQLTVNATGTGTDGIDQTFVIRIANTGGSSTNGVDYKNFANPTDLTFLPGSFTTTSQNIAFDLVEDLNKEGDETIVFASTILNDFTAGQAKVGATPVHTFTIQSDDETVRTYDATVPGDYRFVGDGKGNVQLFVGPTLLSTDAIGTQPILLNGTANVAQPVAGVESATVDYANGSPVPTGGITFNANGPTAGERLIVSGGSFTNATTNLSATQSGTLTLTGATTDTLTYQNVDGVEINATSVGNLTLQLPASASDAVLEDDGISGNGISQIRSANGSFATTKFVNPTGTLTIATGTATDTLTILSPESTSTVIAGSAAKRFATITQNGTLGSNGDVRYFANAATFGDGSKLTAAGAVELNATGTVTLGNTTIAGNTITQDGGSSVNITIANTATLTATGVAGTTILFNGTIDGPGSLTTSSAGETVFKAEIGKTTPLANATFGSPINADATTVTGGSLNIAAQNIAFNAAVSAKNAPIVLTLSGGSATQAAPFTTTKLFLNGNGNFNLNNADNLLTGSGKTIASFVTFVGSNAVTDEAGILALPGELFVTMTGGSINVRDKSDLVIRFENATLNPAIQIGANGNATLTSGADVSIEDPRTQVTSGVAAKDITPLLNVGTGTVQVFVGVDRNDPTTDATIVRYLAEATAGLVSIGSDPILGAGDTFNLRTSPTNPFLDPANLENVAKDTFSVRPMLGSPIRINGNSPVVNDPVAFRPYDTLSPRFAGTGSVNLVPNGTGNGTFSFGNGFQPIQFFSIENVGGIQANSLVVQTGPSSATPANNYAIRLNATISGQPFGSSLSGNGIVTNPFVVSPSLGGVSQFDAPQITFADVDGDTTPDLIIANGTGDAPLITIIKGSRIFSGNNINISALNPDTDLIAQFFAFEESFRGGVQVRAADFNGDGKAELAVSPGIGGGPRIIVYQIDFANPSVFTNAMIYRHKLTNGSLSNPYNFFPYESTFRGGVNVAVGDVNGDGVPDIVAGAGFGGGPRVRVFDGATDPTLADGVTQNPASTIADFFAYDPGFRGGVFVDSGRFDADTIADLVTAPGPGGSAHIQVFQGRKNAQPFEVDAGRGTEFRVPMASFFAFEAQPSLINTMTSRTGVGGVSFGTSTDNLGSSRSILVTRPEGTSFEIVKFDPTLPGDTLTPTDVANKAEFISVAPTNLVLKRTPHFETVLATIADPNNPLPFDVLLDGGSAAGTS